MAVPSLLDPAGGGEAVAAPGAAAVARRFFLFFLLDFRRRAIAPPAKMVSASLVCRRSSPPPAKIVFGHLKNIFSSSDRSSLFTSLIEKHAWLKLIRINDFILGVHVPCTHVRAFSRTDRELDTSPN